VFFNDVSKRIKDAQAEIEIASLKLGDQVQANWLPLFGVVYFYWVINAIGLQVVGASTDSMDIARGISRARR
jgi:Family of unknown function (DUF5335)